MEYAKHPVQFFTSVCYDWLKLLDTDRSKQIIIDALKYRVKAGQVKVCAFVPIAIGMPNHIHLIWRVQNDFTLEEVQRDFLRFTSQQILKQLRNEKSELLPKLEVNAKDRKYQVWQRNSLGIELRSAKVFLQKLEYIHHNPVKASLCKLPEDYQYSSARFYELNINDWDFLTHYED